jgi:hypothetical protein
MGFTPEGTQQYEIVEGLRFARSVAENIKKTGKVRELVISKYGQIMLSRFENDTIR